MTKSRITLAIVILLSVISTTLKAHPHVFITSHINILYNTNGISAIEVKWTFDSMFTQLMIEEYDENLNGEFDKTEVDRLYKTAFINLRKSEYFTHIYIGDDKLIAKSASGFKASIVNGEMVYSFLIPVKISVTTEPKNISIYCYDDSYYMDIMIDEDKPLTSNNSDYIISYSIDEDANKAYYFDQIYPQVIRIKTRKR